MQYLNNFITVQHTAKYRYAPDRKLKQHWCNKMQKSFVVDSFVFSLSNVTGIVRTNYTAADVAKQIVLSKVPELFVRGIDICTRKWCDTCGTSCHRRHTRGGRSSDTPGHRGQCQGTAKVCGVDTAPLITGQLRWHRKHTGRDGQWLVYFFNTIKQREQLNNHTEVMVPEISLKRQANRQHQQQQKTTKTDHKCQKSNIHKAT